MIVLSILTALALERVAVWLHDRGAAESSRARIEAEIASNLADLRRSETANETNTADVKKALAAVLALLRAGTAEGDKVLAVAQPAFSHLSISLPTWRHNAWDSAIADQSASHMKAEDLQRYAEIYSGASDDASTAQLLLSGEWLNAGAERRIDVALGKVSARPLADGMARFLLASEQITANQQALDHLIVPERSGNPAHP